MRLYHLSKIKQDGDILKPRVPVTLIAGFEDDSTPRVCFSKTLSGAIRAINMCGNYGAYYVHVIDGDIDPECIVKCTEDMVPDSMVTDEYWVLCPVKLKCIAKISIGYNDNEYNIRRPYKKHYHDGTNMDGYAVKYPVHFKYLEKYTDNEMNKKLTNKVLNAINTGLLNVLSTDIDDKDIDFDKPDIDNEYIPEISIDDLFSMYNENNGDIFDKKYDTTNAISLILKDNTEISLYEYDENDNEIYPVFIKISNKELQKGNNEILIYLLENNLISKKMVWQEQQWQILPDVYLIEDFETASNDFSGYGNSMNLMKYKKYHTLPALEYCVSLYRQGYQGYLPSTGQLQVMSKYLNMINSVITEIGYDKLELNQGIYWTSDEYSQYDVWDFCHDTIRYRSPKNTKAHALPIFKYKK